MLDRDQKKIKIGVKRNGQKGLCSYQSKNEVPYGHFANLTSMEWHICFFTDRSVM